MPGLIEKLFFAPQVPVLATIFFWTAGSTLARRPDFARNMAPIPLCSPFDLRVAEGSKRSFHLGFFGPL